MTTARQRAFEDGERPERPKASTLVLLRRPLRPDTDPTSMSRFVDDTWHLDQGIFEESAKTTRLNFLQVPQPLRLAAKHYVWVLINIDPPMQLRRTSASRPSLYGIRMFWFALRVFLDWLHEHDISEFCEVTPEILEEYLAFLVDRGDTLEQTYRCVAEVRRLWGYRTVLPVSLRLPEIPPWGGESAGVLLGRTRPVMENLTPRINEDTMSALLLWALRFVEDFADDDNFELFQNAQALPSDDVYFSRTSGSSGRVLTILQDEATSVAGHLFYMRHYEQLLGRERRPDDWVYEVYMCPQRYPELSGNYPSFTVDQECPVNLAFDLIARLRPAILWSLPSYLTRLADEFGDRLSNLGVGAVCTHSEGSTRDERRRLAEMFGVPVLDEYSSEELYLIGTECRYGAYHIVSDNVRVDILEGDAAGQGEIVATSLTNSYMPFIRYRQGDIAQILPGGDVCGCGSRFARLGHFIGRSDQVLRRSDGSRIAPDHVMSAVDRTLLIAGANISEFRITQDSSGAIHLIATIVGDPAAGAGAALAACCATLNSIVADPNCVASWEHVDVMPQNPSYKRRVVTSEFVPTA